MFPTSPPIFFLSSDLNLWVFKFGSSQRLFSLSRAKKGQSAKLKLQSQIDTKVNGVLVRGFPFQSMVY